MTREEIANQAQLAKDCIDSHTPDSQMWEALIEAEAYILRLEERLEISFAFDSEGKPIEVPLNEREEFPDGITCRDATIKSLSPKRLLNVGDIKSIIYDLQPTQAATTIHNLIYGKK